MRSPQDKPLPPGWAYAEWGKTAVAALPLPIRALAADVELLLVGGTVRDVFLGLPVTDIDCVLSAADWQRLPEIAAAHNWCVTVRSQSRTAVLSTEHGDKTVIEVACMRKDYYAAGGILTSTEEADICTDAMRRDATLNTLYVRVRDAATWDPFAATAEPLQWQAVHSDTLAEDPLRVVRIWRFALVSGLPCAAQTERAAAEVARGEAISRLQPPRLRAELDRAVRQGVIEPLLLKMAASGWPKIPWIQKVQTATNGADRLRSLARWCKQNVEDDSIEKLAWIWH